MKIKILVVLIVLVSLFLLLPEPELKADDNKMNTSSLNDNFIIQNVRLYDGNKVYEDVDVMIQDNKVAKIAHQIDNPKDLPVLQAQGKTLIPGLIDSHTHTYGNALQEALNFGVTTELDMFTMPTVSQPQKKARDLIDNNQSADLFSSTILATTTNGHGTEYGFEIPVLNDVNEVEEFVKQRIEDGADYIKAVYNSKKAKRITFPSISYEILAELIIKAHDQNRMLVVHVDNLISAKEAIDLGADGIIHSFMDTVVDQEFIEMMVQNKAFIVPTLSVEASVAGVSNSEELFKQEQFNKFLSKQQKQQLKSSFPDFGLPESAFEKALDSVQLLSQAGVNILAGTDAPNPGTSHGVSLHGELLFLVQAGLSNEQALHSATGAVAKSFNVGQRGTLEVGALASMILLNSNPLDDISNSQDILQIWKNGQAYIRKIQIQENKNPVIKTGLISDFETNLKETTYGAGIFESTDQMAGGKSVVELLHSNESNNKFLHVKGEIIKGFIYRWSGFSFIPAKEQYQAVNLSQIKQLEFQAKSNKANQALSLLLFEKGNYQPKTLELSLSSKWSNYAINLDDFNSVDLTEISNISFVVSQELGEFEFMIDNIQLK